MTLRIQRAAERKIVLFRLIGRIQGDQIPAPQALLRSETSDFRVAPDLKEVKLVDLDAVRFLAESEANGITLRNCSAFIREWILQETNRMRHTEGDVGTRHE